MPELAPGWELHADRGGQWLFVKVKCPEHSYAETPPLAEWVWALLEQHQTHCLILEMDEVRLLYSYMVGQLILLQKRLCIQGGTLRLCGLSPQNREVLVACHLDASLPTYPNREDAVRGGGGVS